MRFRWLLVILVVCILAGSVYGATKWRTQARYQAVVTEVIRQITSQCIPQFQDYPLFGNAGEAVAPDKYCACAAEPDANNIAQITMARTEPGGANLTSFGSLPDRPEDVSNEIWECYDNISQQEVERRTSPPRFKP